MSNLGSFLNEPIGLLLNVAGLLPVFDGLDSPPASILTDDWPTLKALHIMRSLPVEHRKRALKLVELFAEEWLPPSMGPASV